MFLKKIGFLYCILRKKEQTPATKYVTISKNFGKIWCKTGEPKKSYGGLKLLRLDFSWEKRYMDSLYAYIDMKEQ